MFDGRNPTPVDVVNISLLAGFHTCQVVQDFFHQQYLRSNVSTWRPTAGKHCSHSELPGWRLEKGCCFHRSGFKYFLFSPRKLGKMSNLTGIFFKWVGSTTNQWSIIKASVLKGVNLGGFSFTHLFWGSLNGPISGGSNLMQKYGDFAGFALLMVHCLGWSCNDPCSYQQPTCSRWNKKDIKLPWSKLVLQIGGLEFIRDSLKGIVT